RMSPTRCNRQQISGSPSRALDRALAESTPLLPSERCSEGDSRLKRIEPEPGCDISQSLVSRVNESTLIARLRCRQSRRYSTGEYTPLMGSTPLVWVPSPKME